MKKTISLSVVFLLFIVMAVSFIPKEDTPISYKHTSEIVECNPEFYDYDPSVKKFVPSPTEVMLIRKDVANFHGTDSTNFCNAIKKMRETTQPKYKPTTNYPKMSIWDFQTKIHGGKKSSNKNFGTCVHGTKLFLAWHRMYLYFFERILHKYMPEGSTIGLPYWDYQTYDQIPPILRQPLTKKNKITNPLYDETRDKTLSNGGHIPRFTLGNGKKSYVAAAVDSAMKETSFYSFQTALEIPHGAVHYSVGGETGNITLSATAAYDPLFWLLHANVDRLWEKWLTQGDGRCNPDESSDAKWWKASFTFYDEEGNPVSMSASEIIDVAGKLHYKYDNVTSITQKPSSCNKLNLSVYNKPTNLQEKYSISNATIDNTGGKEFELATVANSVSSNASFGFMPKTATTKASPNFFDNNYYIEFEKIKVKTFPSGIIEIHVANKNQTTFSPNDKSFVGLFDLFTALSVTDGNSNHTQDMNDEQDGVYRININEVIKKIFTKAINASKPFGVKLGDAPISIPDLKNTLEDLKNLRIRFIVRGNVLNGVEVKEAVNITIGKLSLAAYKKQ
jgi:hypothetical protein